MTRMKKFNKEKIASLKQRNINKKNFCRNFEFYHLRVILGLYKTLNKKTLDFVWKGGGGEGVMIRIHWIFNILAP